MIRFSLLASSWKKFDWILALGVIMLSFIGLAAIYSVDLSRGDTLIYTPTQILALVIAVIVFFVASQFHVSFYESTSRLAYLVAFILLVAVLFFGVNVRGTTGWFRIFGFSLQPAEIAKVSLIMFLAWRTERQARRFDRWQFVAATLVMTLVLAGLIMLQPDLGSAVILLGSWFGLLLLTGTKRKYIIGLVALAVVVAVVGWFFLLKGYQKERLMTFADPGRDPLGAGYNVTQSIIAVGSGQMMGRGLGFGSQSQLHFLPEAQTDFIFSVISEELGFIGVILVLGLYLLVLWRLVRIARGCRSDFSAYLVLGVSLIFLFHMIINIGAAVGLLPVTGVTLPFLSYGGSSLIISFLLIGIAESAARSS
ncbi:rod shape-determining protein RodA [Candidatus Parcubacteria bacterium]|jgi:rod shape determining protein RodA|nr:rod shape-determining protein RodA [Candidatus Parcubacteria bacterium]MBT3949320.1 rod shape-determining protein RodA [Candidatus Parcubacteria bacterium]